jgi:hypothetical protein
MTPLNQAYRATIAHYGQAIAGLGHTSSSVIATGRLYREFLRQATIMAYSDAFKFVAGILLVLFFVALLMPRNELNAKAPPAPAH